MESQNKKPEARIVDIVDRTLQQIDEASSRVRKTLEERPSTLLAAALGSGLIAGLILRKERSRNLDASETQERPIALFGAAAIAGYAIAPLFLAKRGFGPKGGSRDLSEDTPSNYDDFQEVS